MEERIKKGLPHMICAAVRYIKRIDFAVNIKFRQTVRKSLRRIRLRTVRWKVRQSFPVEISRILLQ